MAVCLETPLSSTDLVDTQHVLFPPDIDVQADQAGHHNADSTPGQDIAEAGPTETAVLEQLTQALMRASADTAQQGSLEEQGTNMQIQRAHESVGTDKGNRPGHALVDEPVNKTQQQLMEVASFVADEEVFLGQEQPVSQHRGTRTPPGGAGDSTCKVAALSDIRQAAIASHKTQHTAIEPDAETAAAKDKAQGEDDEKGRRPRHRSLFMQGKATQLLSDQQHLPVVIRPAPTIFGLQDTPSSEKHSTPHVQCSSIHVQQSNPNKHISAAHSHRSSLHVQGSTPHVHGSSGVTVDGEVPDSGALFAADDSQGATPFSFGPTQAASPSSEVTKRLPRAAEQAVQGEEISAGACQDDDELLKGKEMEMSKMQGHRRKGTLGAQVLSGMAGTTAASRKLHAQLSQDSWSSEDAGDAGGHDTLHEGPPSVSGIDMPEHHVASDTKVTAAVQKSEVCHPVKSLEVQKVQDNVKQGVKEADGVQDAELGPAESLMDGGVNEAAMAFTQALFSQPGATQDMNVRVQLTCHPVCHCLLLSG
jgi:hypothetical protein